VRADGVVVDPVALGVQGQVEDVVDLFEEQPLVLQRAEPAPAGAVLSGCADAGAGVAQLGVGGEERLEPETSGTDRRCRSRS
jgi:hypothetical protein